MRRVPSGLARKRIFSIDEAEKILDVNRDSLRVILSRMEKNGLIERLEQGKYLVVPLTSEKGEYTLHEFVIGSALVEPYSIAYWSALNYHGLTEQIPSTIFIQTTSRKKNNDLNIFGIRYLLVKVSDYKFFGTEKIWIESLPVVVTSREKTIVDCLDKPEYCGGVVEVVKALNNGKFDLDLLASYAFAMKNSGVIRRLGFLCEVLNIVIDLPLVETRSYLYLDPTMPKKGPSNSKWRLKVNLDLGELE